MTNSMRLVVAGFALAAIAGCTGASTTSALNATAVDACQTAFAAKGATGKPTVIAHGTLVANTALDVAMKANTMTQEQTAATHHLDRTLAATITAGGTPTTTGPVFTRFIKALEGDPTWRVEQFTLTAPAATGECLVSFESGATVPVVPAVIAASS